VVGDTLRVTVTPGPEALTLTTGVGVAVGAGVGAVEVGVGATVGVPLVGPPGLVTDPDGEPLGATEPPVPLGDGTGWSATGLADGAAPEG
jgi:hypothetical protein